MTGPDHRDVLASLHGLRAAGAAGIAADFRAAADGWLAGGPEPDWHGWAARLAGEIESVTAHGPGRWDADHRTREAAAFLAAGEGQELAALPHIALERLAATLRHHLGAVLDVIAEAGGQR